MATRRHLIPIRKRLSSSPLLRESYLQVKRIPNRLSDLDHSRPQRRSSADVSSFVVALTSYPARILTVHRTIESLRRQSLAPSRIVLALSTDEFPDRRLPPQLVRLQSRGLELIWSPGNLKSYKKLIPVRARYPGETIVTVDDDVIYSRDFLRDLWEASELRPTSIIGHRGWEIGAEESGRLLPYRSLNPATPVSPPELILLTGVGGIVYPAGSLPDELLQDADLARKVCPRADDIWFWALARVKGTTIYCLGTHPEPFRIIEALRGSEKLGLQNVLGGGNDAQLGRAIAHFGLRDQILDVAARNRTQSASPEKHQPPRGPA